MTSNNVVVLQAGIGPIEKSPTLTLRVDEADLPVVQQGSVDDAIRYALAQPVTILGESYMRRSAPHTKPILEIIGRELEGGYCVRVNGVVVDPLSPMRDYLEDRVMVPTVRMYAIDPSNGEQVPVADASPTEVRTLRGKAVEGVMVDDEFWHVIRKDGMDSKNASDVPPDKRAEYQSFRYAKIEIARPLLPG